jgi:hypothetical protein
MGNTFPDGLNLIFSTIPIAQDDLRETEVFKRPRLFLDHIGIDWRESDIVRAGFKSWAAALMNLDGDTTAWRKVGRCIAATSKSPRSASLSATATEWLRISLEFAFGQPKMNDFKAGCDLRPSMPASRNSVPTPQCCIP